MLSSSTSYAAQKNNSTRWLLIALVILLAGCILFLEISKHTSSVVVANEQPKNETTEELARASQDNREKPQDDRVTTIPVAPHPMVSPAESSPESVVKPEQRTTSFPSLDSLAYKPPQMVMPSPKEEVAKPFPMKKVEKAGKETLVLKEKAKNTKKQKNIKESVRKEDAQYHVVQPGDSLMLISKQYYGTTQYWRSIFKANQSETFTDSKSLKIGQQILLPSLEELAKLSPKSQRPSHTPSRGVFVETAGGKAKALHQPHIHIVQPGETGTSIAKNNNISIALLYELNKATLKNVDELRPGLALIVSAPLAAPKN